MSKNNDLKATIKSLIENVQLGNKSGTEVAQSVNIWLKEGGEAIKVKIEDEVERSVSKMGFVKRGEFEALKQEVAALKKGSASAKKATATTDKKVAKKAAAKKTAVKKSVKKVAKKAAAKKVGK
jgi:BMFP domain-containing protein YqiC